VPLINKNEDKFGFGVPDEKIELDPDVFEEEIDVKTAFAYEKG
jgi:hypothetical protein